MTTKRKRSAIIEEAGVRVRVFLRGDRYWLDVRVPGRDRKRLTADTSDRKTAETRARQVARSVAEQLLLGVADRDVTLGQLLRRYQDTKGRTLEGAWKTSAESRAARFLAAWGDALPVVSISQTHVDTYSAQRRAAHLAQQQQRNERRAALAAERAQPAGERPRRGRPRTAPAPAPLPLRPLRDGALDGDFRWLSSVFNWAMRDKLPTGKRLLERNPLHDVQWPRERNVRRPVASHERYERTLAAAEVVDPSGRLGVVLTLARYTGRRESAILGLRASDVLLSKDRIARALAAAGMDEGLAAHMPDGAIRWAAETDKLGLLHITPISKAARTALERYLAAHPAVGDVPLFPSDEDDTRPLPRSTATKQLVRAEQRADLPKLAGGVFHPYRRLWATERKHFSDVDVAAAGGWRDTKALKLSYQQADPATVLAVVAMAR